ncbi:MAG: hypothetical protein PF487_08450 [Bacteroidales bacterium]|jgi:hypothetical protein|nr:hypothetical protein [Bacteroidales bacterium]
MKKKVAYSIIQEKKMIIEYYCEDIFIDDLINLKKDISNNEYYKPTYNLIMDFRDSNLMFDEKGVLKYIEFVRTHPKVQGHRRTAFLTDKPNEVVQTTLFASLKGDLPIDTNIYINLESAINWILLPPTDFNLIKSSIEKLKTQLNNT